MVFSFFKKPAEKMPERPAARPKPPAGATPVSDAPASAPPAAPASAPAAAPAAPASARDTAPGAFRDSMFGEEFTLSNIMAIEVEHDVDPLKVDIEQAAVLFANGQDAAARAVLENAARAHSGPEAERLWRMLFDLLQVIGDRASFDKLGMEFAQTCETSPPAWRDEEQAPAKPAAAGSGTSIVLQGVITGNDSPGFARLREALDKRQPLQINLGKLAGCDDLAAGTLTELLKKARKIGLGIALEGADGLVGRLQGRIATGTADYEKGWLLLLELYQLLGLQEQFEEKAVDYAITFEVSPPSWETLKAGSVKSLRETVLEPVDESFALTGECKSMNLDELRAYLDLNDHPVIDCARLKRLDFASAGGICSLLGTHAKAGKEIVIRHPHHLVAELMNIVGIGQVARILVTRS